MKASAASAALAVVLFSSMTNAFFRLPCSRPVVVDRLDPIVNPGKVSGHLHTIMGGNGFAPTMDYAQARNSTCSTCSVKQDLSNYWTPTLYIQNQNGSFHPVKQVGGALVYYLQRRGSGEKLQAFPEGFRMLAGDPFLRSFSGTPEQKAVSFACLDYNNPSPETPGFPTKNCPHGLRTQVFFPSCWNGKDLDSSDHKSHMAYPDRVDGGKCPSSHPIRLISIFYEIMFDIDEWKDDWLPGGKWPFVLSNGDPTGYGFHGDFINGWDVPTLQKAVDSCTDNSGVIEKCPFFEFWDKNIQNDCHLGPRVDEPTTGWIDRLPGCNEVTYGPDRAVPKNDCGATVVVGEPKIFHTDVSSLGWSYDGCALDDLNSRTLGMRTAANDMTVEKCINYCISKGQTYAGLEYSNECYCGTSIAPDRKGDYKCMIPCKGDPSQYCGDARRLSVYTKGAVGTSPKPLTKPPATTKAPPTATPTSTSKSPSTSTSKATATPTSVPTATPTSTSKSPSTSTSKATATPTSHCQSKGFKYAGTEHAGQCFCGNELKIGSLKPTAECNMPCKGNKQEMCGGPKRLTLFEYAPTKKRWVSRIKRRRALENQKFNE
ncbi:hypothetical protein BDZ91DRAFT_771969 [Kalaharituber pfeilii]|nr:hypothetical protein BDZ91DRAFT_771969 [Kalaharituber pfeilii]